MVVTPGDILGRCRALDARIAASQALIDQAPLDKIDATFRHAWDARTRRWRELREGCADWFSRQWNYKWGPTLDDWFQNQAEWETKIEERTGSSIPVPAPIKPDEETPLPSPSPDDKLLVGAALGAAAILGVAWLASARTRR